MDRRELDKNRPPMGGAYTSWKNIKWNTRLGSLILGFWDSKFHLSREKNNKTYRLFRTCGLYFIVLSVYPISKWTLIYSFGSITVARRPAFYGAWQHVLSRVTFILCGTVLFRFLPSRGLFQISWLFFSFILSCMREIATGFIVSTVPRASTGSKFYFRGWLWKILLNKNREFSIAQFRYLGLWVIFENMQFASILRAIQKSTCLSLIEI